MRYDQPISKSPSRAQPLSDAMACAGAQWHAAASQDCSAERRPRCGASHSAGVADSRIERQHIEIANGLGGRRVDFVGLDATITDVLFRFQTVDGAHSTSLIDPSKPWIDIPNDPGMVGLATAYLTRGIAISSKASITFSLSSAFFSSCLSLDAGEDDHSLYCRP